ncbi:MAG: STAS domain-containing protein [Anaerolineae bacterium]|nr:STAS domain-containing protein [Anaerolineae bacterium]
MQTTDQTQHIGVNVVHGKLDASTYTELEAEHEKHFASGGLYFVVDLREATFIDSTGLSTLVKIYKQIQAINGKLLIVRPNNPSAMNILSITRFDQVFFMIDSLDAALRYVNDIRKA